MNSFDHLSERLVDLEDELRDLLHRLDALSPPMTYEEAKAELDALLAALG